MEQDFSWVKWSKQEGNRTQQGAGRKSPGDQGDAEMRPISLAPSASRKRHRDQHDADTQFADSQIPIYKFSLTNYCSQVTWDPAILPST